MPLPKRTKFEWILLSIAVLGMLPYLVFLVVSEEKLPLWVRLFNMIGWVSFMSFHFIYNKSQL